MPDNTGKLVTVSYTGTLDNGWQFAQATPGNPLRFPCIDGFMLPEFVEAVRDMAPGETRAFRVGPETAFLEHHEDFMVRVETSKLPRSADLSPGDIVHLQGKDGTEYPARLVSFDEDTALFDANHEAVAQGLNFEITLHAVKETRFPS